jgi:hypothetical protein
MCIAPNTLQDGQQVGCRNCWQCRQRAINDWTGRNIAESKTATASNTVTLTYGRNALNETLHERAVILTYSDVQKYIKLLRFHGFPVRYFITGEFGEKKGRAHWHGMLYWQGVVPPLKLERNFDHDQWKHGHTFWTEPSVEAIRYCCKYVYKQIKVGGDLLEGHLAMSRMPPIGFHYFDGLAARYVAQGLAPQSLEYTFPEVTTGQGADKKPVVFMLKDRMAQLFAESYIAHWKAANPNAPMGRMPNSVYLDEIYKPADFDRLRATWWDKIHMPKPRPSKTVWRFRDMYDWQIAWNLQESRGLNGKK